jgi:uncharacterized protein (DUF1800 family)
MISRRRFLQFGSALTASAALGCDRLPAALLWGDAAPDDTAPFVPPAGTAIDRVAHVLARLSYGARPGEYARVRALGGTPAVAAAAYVREQLTPERLDDALADRALRRLGMLELPAGELYEYKSEVLLETLTRARLLRAHLSSRQLHEVMVELWTDHFNIDASKGDCRWLKAADDRDVIRKHAMGHFRDLVRASALSPAMLWYLDGRVNRRAGQYERPNENYARELLELHTLGVHGGYTQRDVMEVARALTGWTVRSKGESSFGIGKVEFHPELHDDGEKEVLGQRLAPGLGARDVDAVVDIVCAHQATARHVATRLCRRFIADDPPARAVARVAETFRLTGGDIRPTLATLFDTKEFAASSETKLKRPFHFVVSALRATDAMTDAGPALQEYLTRMGHAPFQYPTPDGYADEATPWTSTLLWRWNFAMALERNRIVGTRVTFDALRRRAGGDAGLAAHLLGRRPTSDEWNTCRAADDKLALLIASPAFQRY